MPETRLELVQPIRPRDFKSLVSTNSTTPALLGYITIQSSVGQGAKCYFFGFQSSSMISIICLMNMTIYPRTADSHTHILEMEKKGINVREILKTCFNNGMSSILDAAVDEHNFERRLSFKEDFPGVFFSAGVHPSSISDIEHQIAIIDEQLKNEHVVAVGETGLDFYWDTVAAEKQKEMFARHIHLSREHKLPLIVHNRLADKEVLELLKSEKADRGVLHCFSSNYHFAKKFIDLGFYISFAGNITYKKSEEIRTAASKVPFDRILVETDAPYLSPQKFRGKINHPGNISQTINCIADLFNKGADETAYQTFRNYKELFQLDIDDQDCRDER